jgi:hypothetical protein
MCNVLLAEKQIQLFVFLALENLDLMPLRAYVFRVITKESKEEIV